MKPTYDPTKEHIVDITDETVAKQIQQGRETFERFVRDHANFDLEDGDLVEKTYQAALNQGIFDQAANLRETVFGNVTTTYGVSYVSDGCFSTCSYCPIRVDATDDDGKRIKRKTLSLEEFVLDTQEIIKDGHSHICFLAGDGTLLYDPVKKETRPHKTFLDYVKAANLLEGVDEIILNITPQTFEGFQHIREAAPDTSLQFRVFQETYNREVYAQKHAQPSANGKLGPKADYDFRRQSQDRAMQAGFDNYGLGVLLGLNPHAFEELEGLVEHSDELTAKYGKAPARVCLPTANELVGVNNVEQQVHVSSQANELMYALAKLAMGNVSIVSSERDNPDMLRTLDRYATNRTVDVQPKVGGNLAQVSNDDRLLGQTTVFPTDPDEAKKDYANRGYELRFNY